MQLLEFSFISPVIKSADVFQAIETVIPSDVIEQTLGQTNSVEERKRKLPSQLVVSLIIAMSLWSSDSMGTVLKNLVNGLSRQWTRLGQYWQVPNSGNRSGGDQKNVQYEITRNQYENQSRLDLYRIIVSSQKCYTGLQIVF